MMATLTQPAKERAAHDSLCVTMASPGKTGSQIVNLIRFEFHINRDAKLCHCKDSVADVYTLFTLYSVQLLWSA